MTRQQHLEPPERPFLQGLGQQRVVRVGEGASREVPGLIPIETRIIEQDAHQLGDCQRRMRVVELDRGFFGESVPVGVVCPEAAHEVGQRARDEEVLLQEAQALAARRRVVGVEHARQRFRGERFGERRNEIPAAEALEIEVVGRRGAPQAQRVDGLAAKAHDGPIERDAEQAERPTRDQAQEAVAHRERAVEPYLHSFLRTSDLPRVLAPEPMVRLFLLPAITDKLLEDAVLVAQPVAHGRQLHRRHRVEETGRQPPEPAIAEARIGLLLEHAEPIDVLPFGEIRKDPVEHQVGDIIRQRPSDQELHRQVIHMLRVLARVGFLRQHPSLREDVAHRPGQGLESLARPRSAGRHDVVEDEVALVERIVGPQEGDLAAAVLRKQRGGVDRPGRNRRPGRLVS